MSNYRTLTDDELRGIAEKAGRLKGAHYVDLQVRAGGRDVEQQGDWVKSCADAAQELLARRELDRSPDNEHQILATAVSELIDAMDPNWGGGYLPHWLNARAAEFRSGRG